MIINRLHQVLRPFVLRRLKHKVLNMLYHEYLICYILLRDNIYLLGSSVSIYTDASEVILPSEGVQCADSSNGPMRMLVVS